MSDSSLLLIGKIRGAHGIRGEVGVAYYAESPSLLRGAVYLRRGAEPPARYEAASFRQHHGALLVRFENVPDRTAAERLRGYDVLVPKERLPQSDGDAVYIHEILGLCVVAVDETGRETLWGTIADVAEPAGQEIWTIRLPGEEDILFPAAPEFVRGFDFAGGTVTILPPRGLLELYRS